MFQKTVSELAKECGVTSQTLNKFFRDNDLRDRLEKRGKRYYVPEDISELAIRRFISSDSEDKGESVSESFSGSVSESSSTITLLEKQLDILNEQLRQKDAQLAEKDKQISALAELIQSLTDSNKALAANATIHTAADKQEQLILTSENQGDSRQEEKKGFWSRLFGK